MVKHLALLSFVCASLVLGASVQAKQRTKPNAKAQANAVLSKPVDETPLIGQSAEENVEDASGRVGRLSYLDGQVFLSLGENPDEWTNGSLNAPVLAWDSVYTNKDSHAELQLGDGVVIRMGPETMLGITALEDDVFQVQLDEGFIGVCAGSLFKEHTPLEVSTANGTIRWSGTGRGLMTITSDKSTRVWPLEGAAEASGQGGVCQTVGAGERLDANATGGYPMTLHINMSPPQAEPFLCFADERGQLLARGITPPQVNQQVIGAEDLDQYGQWTTTPEYGPVWRPKTVVETWSPYQSGRWVYRHSCGWCWLPDEPWGWCTHHYGRWVYLDSYWGWTPYECGYAVTYPVWSPAYVGFYYADDDFSLGVSFGGGSCIGWVPLGPHDPYWGYAWHYRHGFHDDWHHGHHDSHHEGDHDGHHKPEPAGFPPRPRPEDAANIQLHEGQGAQWRQPAEAESGVVNHTFKDFQNRTAPGAVTVSTTRGFVTGDRASAKNITLKESDSTKVRVLTGSPAIPTKDSLTLRPPAERSSASESPPVPAPNARLGMHNAVSATRPGTASPQVMKPPSIDEVQKQFSERSPVVIQPSRTGVETKSSEAPSKAGVAQSAAETLKQPGQVTARPGRTGSNSSSSVNPSVSTQNRNQAPTGRPAQVIHGSDRTSSTTPDNAGAKIAPPKDTEVSGPARVNVQPPRSRFTGTKPDSKSPSSSGESSTTTQARPVRPMPPVRVRPSLPTEDGASSVGAPVKDQKSSSSSSTSSRMRINAPDQPSKPSAPSGVWPQDSRARRYTMPAPPAPATERMTIPKSQPEGFMPGPRPSGGPFPGAGSAPREKYAPPMAPAAPAAPSAPAPARPNTSGGGRSGVKTFQQESR